MGVAGRLDDLLKLAIERGASDLHLKAGSAPVLRIDGQLVPLLDQPRCTPEAAVEAAFSVMTDRQKEIFRERSELDLSYGISGVGRFRVNVFQQRGTVAIALRIIPSRIRTFEELHLPKTLERLAQEPRGLLIVTGTTRSGKSTTLAAMVDYINANRGGHIVTIEDPIEYLFRDKRGLVNQREVGTDTPSFAEALRSALRQDPDILMVGEMRDHETIATGLIAAETGHLVLTSLHTIDAPETVNRVIAFFPPYQHLQVRLQLAAVLKGVISQRLIARADGRGLVPAVEVLVSTPTVREHIVEAKKTRALPDVIAAGKSQYGMQTFDQSLMDLYGRGLVTLDEALHWSSNPHNFALRVRGVESTAEQTWTMTDAKL
jgi:twitching motility protein PilT